jgi:hypothetical protein
MTDPVEERLTEAYRTGERAALADWASTGRPGLLLLRDFLTEVWDPGPMKGTHSRDLVDNLSAVVAAIAVAHPTAFLDVFDDDRYRESTYVLTGLGQIDDPHATERILRAVGSRDSFTRMHVAIGLGRRPSLAATETLGRLVSDDEYLVRYHALQSLARIGDASVLPILRRSRPDSSYEVGLVEETISAIEGRAADGPATR